MIFDYLLQRKELRQNMVPLHSVHSTAWCGLLRLTADEDADPDQITDHHLQI